jgi:tetratricopeptide (TPR) repeat protein
VVERDCSLEEFSEIYKSFQQSNRAVTELEVSTANMFYEHSLATVWQISVTRLNKDCSKLLAILSYFDPDGVPEALLREGAKGSQELDFLVNGLQYLDTVGELIREGLITKSRTQVELGGSGQSKTAIRSLSVHRLVQETVFHQQTAEEQNATFLDAFGLLRKLWPTNPENEFRMNALWTSCALYLPHVLALEARCHDSPTLRPPTELVDLFFRAAWYLYERRLSEVALPLLHTARKICKRDNDTNPFFAKVLTAYGCIYMEMGRINDAATYFEQVVDIYQKRPDPNDWLLATSISDLALTHTDRGNYKQSKELYDRALAIVATIEDPAMRKEWQVHVQHNLSRAYIEMGQPEEAIKLQFFYGDEFAEGLISEMSQRGALFLYGIGNAYLALARKKGVEGAEDRRIGVDYHTRVLRTRKQLCGEQYLTGISLHKVGVLLHEDGELEGAADALLEALKIFETSFEAQRELARTTFHLAMVKSDQGHLRDSERLLTEAWQIRERLTGEERMIDDETSPRGFDKLVFYVHN